MSFRALRTLVAIEQTGSFAAAGERLGLTQAAVSTQIRQLEEHLQVRLFDRVGRKQVLNHDGRIVLERAQRIVALYAQLDEGLGAAGQFRGELLLGAIFSIQTGPLGPVLAQLRARYPELKIKVFHGMSIDLAERVERGLLDAAIITEPMQTVPVDFEWSTLEREPFYVIAPRDIPPASDAELLAQHPFIRLDPRAWAGSMIDNELRRRGIAPNEMMELDSLQAALMMVEQGLGVTVMALGRDKAAALAARFCLVPFGEPVLQRNVGLYQRASHGRKALVSVLLAAFGLGNT
ncbi:LysR family transcriptional regulator [Denitromonas ohlonensis]|jgi:DNA-binding transcriptional LysR family regulator|uniref:LysR family transcriptional regulator n=2 Tax=Denitromonas TaxID=139331 RepID=A0A558CQS6_9RHOO|nr:LysR family transcriptional regulator [Denitromonas ohlonensis]TVT51128.1 MAG: LysR family transcriptional regulator [Denitromonas halophila]TVO68460.1 LysR family transcriptional regulator [Denitromonas ohlonensis]TVO74738.1 LysR family transcriptional regulator [Denitromonas ohlonensis]TVT71277.1 MAG: LysR family transcriptional regulator [Denitromonas halophila]TVT72243.1 MAG: LysR family transcriptional regulator [Denitromonas halophila]